MREESRRRYRSSSRDRDSQRRAKSHKSYKKSKKSKKSKKHSRRSSSSSSSSSSYESRESHYHHSRRSNTRAPSSESNSRTEGRSKTRPSSSENSRATVTSKEIPAKEIDLTDAQVQSALSTIEEDKFEAKSFFSTRDREAPPKKLPTDKVIIDLKSETVQLPKPMEQLEITKEQIFHPNFIGDPEIKMEKWLRKLYNFRRKHFED